MDTKSILAAFAEYNVGDVLFQEPLAKHTTWRIGGPADALVIVRSISELQGAVLAAKSIGMPIAVLGRGSNVLVQDGGVRGLVLKMGDAFAHITVDGRQVTALAGRSFVSAANIAIRHNLAGLEFATGIPGSVGGAVMMNAGAHGGEVKDVLEWAQVLDGDGSIQYLSREELKFSYRYSILKDQPMIVMQATFQLQPGDGTRLAEQVKLWSLKRAQSQPLSLPNCGSVFRNPEGTFAGHLIESSGLKGLRRGDAQISDKHANFIVNLGHATAGDVLWLIHHVKETIRQAYHVELETEVRVIGEPTLGR